MLPCRLANPFPLKIYLLISLLFIFYASMGNQCLAADNWNQLQYLDLATAGRIALADNPGIEAAKARVLQAKARLSQAQAAYWPRLDATAAALRLDRSENSLQANGLGIPIENPDEAYRLGLAASWTLFDGFERKFTRAAALYGESQTKSQEREAWRLLLFAVSEAYFSAQLAQENVAIANADEAFNQQQLSIAKSRLQVGTGSLSDVLNFEIRVNDAKSTRIRDENIYETTMIGLAALMGLSDPVLPAHLTLKPLMPETPQELSPPKIKIMVQYAKTHRPDLTQTKYRVKALQAQIRIAQAGYYPQISLAASIDGDRTGDTGFESDDFGNSVALNLKYNLFAGGFTKAKVSETRQQLTEAQKELDQLRISIASEVRQSIARVNASQKQLFLQRTNAALVSQNRTLVQKGYQAGQESLVRLNQAQRDMTAAQARLALALVSLRQAWFDLEADTGRILELFIK